MRARKNLSPSAAVSTVLNGTLDAIEEVRRENERLAKQFQPAKPVPKINVQEMLAQVKELVQRYFDEMRREQGPDWLANPNDWAHEAERALQRDLLHLARETDDANLLEQIHTVWPERRPPRPLVPEELKQLANLQERFDDLASNLEGTVTNSLEELWNIVQAEAGIVQGTSGSRLLLKQAGEFVNYLGGVINNLWGYLTGATVTDPESFQKESRRWLLRTKRWGR